MGKVPHSIGTLSLCQLHTAIVITLGPCICRIAGMTTLKSGSLTRFDRQDLLKAKPEGYLNGIVGKRNISKEKFDNRQSRTWSATFLSHLSASYGARHGQAASVHDGSPTNCSRADRLMGIRVTRPHPPHAKTAKPS
ncbi:hypothetical protein CC86DRAFT_49000 [Ophiobolus disseminans]|uniref:Uncharacterized protein n=1 Tax=Ophiobolus disseminans TaxID=1469910 RepID=A0A6A6ZWS4_9PLEO|nr:hypothetical protein CC86DRAFT_49000 [Ophiobolus disseminans]